MIYNVTPEAMDYMNRRFAQIDALKASNVTLTQQVAALEAALVALRPLLEKVIGDQTEIVLAEIGAAA